MAGIFPIDLIMHDRPVGHGYTNITVDKPNPFFAVGREIKGHEFHYSGISGHQDEAGLGQLANCLSVNTGTGLGNKRDGLLFNNTFACYTHIHALGEKSWAANMVRAAMSYKSNNSPAKPAGLTAGNKTGNHNPDNIMLSSAGN